MHHEYSILQVLYQPSNNRCSKILLCVTEIQWLVSESLYMFFEVVSIFYIWILTLSCIFHFWSQEEKWYLWQQKSWSVVPDRVFMWQKWQPSLLSNTMLRWYLLCQIYCDIQNWGITTLKKKTAQQLKCILKSL